VHLRDAHYAGAGRLRHGAAYTYVHDEPFGVAPQQYAPDVVGDARYYQPTRLGAEAAAGERHERLRAFVRGTSHSAADPSATPRTPEIDPATGDPAR
jgi:putative ATPase